MLLLWIGYKVYKIVKFNDKVMLSMIFFLNLELMSKIFFYTLNAHQDEKGSNKDDEKSSPIVTISLILPIVFLSIAIIINLRNWIYYFVKIGDMAFHTSEEFNQKTMNMHLQAPKLTKLLDCITLVLTLLILSTLGVVV